MGEKWVEKRDYDMVLEQWNEAEHRIAKLEEALKVCRQLLQDIVDECGRESSWPEVKAIAIADAALSIESGLSPDSIGEPQGSTVQDVTKEHALDIVSPSEALEEEGEKPWPRYPLFDSSKPPEKEGEDV